MFILIVEDNADAASLLARVLRKDGHVCEIAPTLAKAIATASKGHFDVAMVDFGLPDGDGATLGPLFREKGIKCIAITGEVDASERLNEGFIAAVVKPINFADLAVLLNKVGGG